MSAGATKERALSIIQYSGTSTILSHTIPFTVLSQESFNICSSGLIGAKMLFIFSPHFETVLLIGVVSGLVTLSI